MQCPECRRMMGPWLFPGQDAEVYVCRNSFCNVVKITVARSIIGVIK